MLVYTPAMADPVTENKRMAFVFEKTFQFKPVVEGDIIHHEFIIKNTGTAPLEILKIDSG